jgi:hypothetical protein
MGRYGAPAAIDPGRQAPLQLGRAKVRIDARLAERFVHFVHRRSALFEVAARQIDFGKRCVGIGDDRCIDAVELQLSRFARVEHRHVRGGRLTPVPSAGA